MGVGRETYGHHLVLLLKCLWKHSEDKEQVRRGEAQGQQSWKQVEGLLFAGSGCEVAADHGAQHEAQGEGHANHRLAATVFLPQISMNTLHLLQDKKKGDSQQNRNY